jgi:hypothetical protein
VLMANMLLSHEFAHMKNGHMAISPKLSDLQRRALEFDADAFSCNMNFGTAWGLIGRRLTRLSTPNPTWSGIPVKKPEDAIKFLATASYLVFRFFDDNRSVQQIWQGIHPPALIRSLVTSKHYTVNIGYHNLMDGFTVEDFIKTTYLPVIAAIERGLFELGDQARTAEEIDQFFQLHRYYLAEMLRAWGSVRSDLEPVLLGGVLAPVHPNPFGGCSAEGLRAARKLPGWPAA